MSVQVSRWAKIDLSVFEVAWSETSYLYQVNGETAAESSDRQQDLPEVYSNIVTPEGTLGFYFQVHTSTGAMLEFSHANAVLGTAWANATGITNFYRNLDQDPIVEEYEHRSEVDAADFVVRASFAEFIITNDPPIIPVTAHGGIAQSQTEEITRETHHGVTTTTSQVVGGSMPLLTYYVPDYILVHVGYAPQLFTDADDHVDFSTVSSEIIYGTLYFAGDGNDVVQLPDLADAAVLGFDYAQGFDGGGGNDTIYSSNDAADIIHGGAGDDTLIASVGNLHPGGSGEGGPYQFFGDAGNDTLYFGTADTLSYDGGYGGRDIADFDGSWMTNAVNTSTGASQGSTQFQLNRVEYLVYADRTIQLADTTDLGMDGRADILIRTASGGVDIVNGASHQPRVSVLGATGQRIVGVADLNSDGKDDVLMQNAVGWLYYRDGGGANVNIGFGGTVRALGDFNGDGAQDILVSNDSGWYSYFTEGAFPGEGGNVNVGLHSDETLLGVGDLDGDGKDDLIFRSNATGWIYYTAGNGSSVHVGFRNQHLMAAVADLDGDGRDDLVFQHEVSGWMSYASGGGTNVNLGSRLSNAVIGTGDFDNDGRDDLLYRNTDGYLSYAYGGLGNYTIGHEQNRAVMAVDDFDGDGWDDLLMRDIVTDQMTVLREANNYLPIDIGLANGQILSTDHGLNVDDDMLFA